MKTHNQKIVKWNQDRNLIKTIDDLNIEKEISYIVEECIEMICDIKSEEARPAAEQITKYIMAYADGKTDRERIVDGAGDINVFATGLIRKTQYDPDIAMDEVIKEINSRVGSIKNGKFVKDKSPEAMANWYTANFDKADLL